MRIIPRKWREHPRGALLTYRRGSGPPIQSTPSHPIHLVFRRLEPSSSLCETHTLNAHFPLRSFSRFPPPFSRGNKEWRRSWYISCAFLRRGFERVWRNSWCRLERDLTFEWAGNFQGGSLLVRGGISPIQFLFPFDQNYSDKKHLITDRSPSPGRAIEIREHRLLNTSPMFYRDGARVYGGCMFRAAARLPARLLLVFL